VTSLVQSARKGLFVPIAFFFVACGILVSLGAWQLHRLAWKETLIEEIATRSKAPPQPLPDPASWPQLAANDYAYRHVRLTGTFENDDEAHVFYGTGPHELGPGYLIFTPLRLRSGAIVIVNRGFVPASLAAQSTRAKGELSGEVTLAGLMRPPEERNLFTPADEPDKNLYFSRDPAPIAAHFHLSQVAPFIVDADPAPVPGGWPIGGMTQIDIPNNHLSYALTWFGLAVGLVATFAGWLRARMVEQRGEMVNR